MPIVGSGLSEREQEILHLLATGASNKEIAQQLFLSPNTVKVHLRNIYIKIGVNSRTEAALYAVNVGLAGSGALLGESASPNILADGSLSGENTLRQGAVAETARGFRRGWKFYTLLAAALLIVLITGSYVGRFLVENPQDGSLYQGISIYESPRWKVLASMPTARYGLAAVVYQESIFAIAGHTVVSPTGTVERYDPTNNSWTTLSPKPTPVYEIGAVVVGGRIYVPGGRLESGETSTVLEIYDPRKDVWEQGARMPRGLSAYALTVYEGTLYLFGGWDGKDFVDIVFSYDPVMDTWDEKQRLPSARGFAGATTTGGRILILGGYDGRSAFKDNLIFQPDLDEETRSYWQDLQAMPVGRYGMGVTSIAEVVLVVGGTDARGRSLTSLEFFPLTNEWKTFEQLSPQPWTELAVVPLGGNIYILGGKHDTLPTDEVFSYQAIYTLAIPVVR